MRYHATVAGKQFTAEVETLGDGRFAVTVDGERCELNWAPIGAGAASLLISERSHNIHFEEEGDEIVIYLGNRPFRIDVANEQRFRLRAGTAKFTQEGRQVVVAPMPGKVTRVLVRLGEEVTEGQGLVVVEAMKMENELKSPKSGKVVALQAQEGSAIEKNATLLVVE
ncbi:MAG TPA: biotin/lipoyl-containing protein [Myxococcaceae bacterium]|nr:biotin/lipoyl-containing protein [Myxococcaceae bacterium]